MKRSGKQSLAINFDRVDPTHHLFIELVSLMDGFSAVREISLKLKDNAVDNADV